MGSINFGKHQIDGAPVTPFSAINGTLIDDTTKRAIKAAVAGKRHWITAAKAVNKTSAETPTVQLYDGTPTLLAALCPGDPDVSPGGDFVEFNPPIEVAAGLKIDGAAVAAVGDCYVTIVGYVED
jgi:hypothetical protein